MKNVTITLAAPWEAASYTARTPMARHPPRGWPRMSVDLAVATESRE
jgi:hypothetical protein